MKDNKAGRHVGLDFYDLLIEPIIQINVTNVMLAREITDLLARLTLRQLESHHGAPLAIWLGTESARRVAKEAADPPSSLAQT